MRPAGGGRAGRAHRPDRRVRDARPPSSGSCCSRRSSSRTARPACGGWRSVRSSAAPPSQLARGGQRGRSRCGCACWARVLEERGVAALFEAVCVGEPVQPRLLGHTGGERLLTDLRHLDRGAARGGARGPARPDRAARLAAPPARRRRRRGRAGAQPPAGVRRRRGAGHHRPHEQGPGVPGRARALRVGPLVAGRAGDRGLPRRGRPAGARRRRQGQPRLGRARAGAQAGRGRRRAAPDLRRAHPCAGAAACCGGPAARTRRPRRCTGCCCTTARTACRPRSVPVPSDDDALAVFRRRAAGSDGRPAGRGGAGTRGLAGRTRRRRTGAGRSSLARVRPTARHALAAHLATPRSRPPRTRRPPPWAASRRSTAKDDETDAVPRTTSLRPSGGRRPLAVGRAARRHVVRHPRPRRARAVDPATTRRCASWSRRGRPAGRPTSTSRC